jgi:transcription initiation factor TFIIH subunit 1
MISDVTSYTQVKLKNNEGSLVLSSDDLSFRPTVGPPSNISWRNVSKHQVSPATHSKALLKIVFSDGKNATFRLENREELERIRKDISARLQAWKSAASAPVSGRRRSHAELSVAFSSFGEMDATALAVTRSALLAANPTLLAQYRYLVEETQTVSEDDFWKTHQSLVEEEYAKICGTKRAGTSSLLQSHLPLQGRVTLGVEEMRQIFVLYPAVHKAYEEKVPLELSDEQFWRKYLESEFFHRDRGRMGTTARNHGAPDAQLKRKDTTASGKSAEEEDARAAAVGTDDLFSRYDSKLRENQGKASSQSRKWGTHLAVGQFDLAATLNTERGHLLEGPRDEHPPNSADDGKGARVVKKYNRHWAMVLHPDEAVAGSNLTEVARRSVQEALEEDDDAKANGGVDQEMRRLVGYANAEKEDANHVLGTGVEDDDYEELTLSNIEAYYTGSTKASRPNKETEKEELKRKAVFAKAMATKMRTLAAPFMQNGGNGNGQALSQQDCFPPAELGRDSCWHSPRKWLPMRRQKLTPLPLSIRCREISVTASRPSFVAPRNCCVTFLGCANWRPKCKVRN